jgi:ketosteroid isomerase-like protein
MSDEKFEAILQQLRAINARDVDAYMAYSTEDIELVPATGMIEGTYRGRSGIERFFADLSDVAVDIELSVDHVEPVGDRVLSFESGSGTGRVSEVGLEVPFTSIYEFRDRRISRVRVFLDRQEALKAVGLSDNDAHADS